MEKLQNDQKSALEQQQKQIEAITASNDSLKSEAARLSSINT